MNACPPAYRNLSPKAECALRSKRLCVDERPGRLPVSPDPNKGKANGALQTRSQQIIAALKKRPMRRFELVNAIGGSPQLVHYTLTAMREGGVIEMRHGGRRGALWALAGVQG